MCPWTNLEIPTTISFFWWKVELEAKNGKVPCKLLHVADRENIKNRFFISENLNSFRIKFCLHYLNKLKLYNIKITILKASSSIWKYNSQKVLSKSNILQIFRILGDYIYIYPFANSYFAKNYEFFSCRTWLFAI